MNRKMFALLLLLPVAVFATDKLTSTADGGGKEKRKAAPDAQAAAAGTGQAEAEAPAGPSLVATLQEEPPRQAQRLDTRAAIQEVRAMLEDIEGQQYEGELIYPRQPEMGKERTAWLLANVKTPLEKANPVGIDIERAFSRCPSGYRVTVVAQDGRPTNEGWLIADRGCMDQAMGKFRYDMQAGTVEVKAGPTLGYLPLDQYLKLYKAAIS